VAGVARPAGNQLLRRQRVERGWSQDRLVRELARVAEGRGIPLPPPETLKPQVSRWENGRKAPNDLYRALLRTVYATSDRDLGFPGEGSPVSLEVPDGWAGGPSSGARLRTAINRSSRVDAGVIIDLRDMTDSCRRLDRRFGGRSVGPSLVNLLDEIEGLAAHSTTPALRQQLASVCGDVGTLLGWLALDVGDPNASWRYYQRATAAARESADTAVLAFALAESAYVPLQLGLTDDALGMVDQALAVIGSRSAPRLRAWLHGARAEVLSHIGDADGCRREMDAAREALATGKESDGSAASVAYLDPTHLDRWSANCLVRVGHPDARGEVEAALASMDDTFVRARAGLLVDRAALLVADDDLEQACRTAAQATINASETNSTRQLSRVRALLPRLACAAGTDAYALLVDQLAASPSGSAERPART
jgi:transcriptional regulator with XRE-family HTH domain